MKTVDGLLLNSPGAVEIRQVISDEPGPGELQVQVDNMGLCGSDIHLYHGSYSGPSRYPLYFGHEWGGVVLKVGENVAGFEVGDRVVGDCSIYCGECDFCRSDRNLCENIEKFGITIDGASKAIFTQKAKYLYRLPDEFPLDMACLVEPVAVAMHGVRRIAHLLESGDEARILVLGGGAIGLSVLLVLKLMYGCSNIQLVDVLESRITRARDLGAEPLDNNLLLSGISGGSGGSSGYSTFYDRTNYDIVFETTGSPAAFNTMLDVTRPGGSAVCIGFIPDTAIEYRLKQITLKALTLMGSIGGTGEFESVIRLISGNREKFRHIVTHVFDYTDYQLAFSTATDKERAVKVAVKFSVS